MMAGVQNAKLHFEAVTLNEGGVEAKKDKKAKTKLSPCLGKVKAFMKSSRYAGIPLALIFGLYFYYLLTFFIFTEPDEIGYSDLVKAGDRNISLSRLNEKVDCELSTLGTSRDDLNSTELNETMASIELQNHLYGLIGGGTVAFTLGTASIFSTELRCTMMLIIPGLFAGRGRAFILTAGMGLLIDGPIDSINANLEQIVNSVTCMYTHMKSLACRFKTSSAKIFEQVGKILKIVEDNMKARLAEIEKKISSLTGDAQKEFIALKKKIEKDLEDYQNALGGLKDVIDAPGNFLNGACSWTSSAISSAGDWFSGAGESIGGWFSDTFGRRKKRDNGCGIQPVVPDLNINVPGLDLNKLKEYAKTLRPDLDFLDMNLDGFSDALQAQSISSIRLELVNLLKVVFQTLKERFFYLKRIFYLSSLVFLLIDAYRYMIQYHSDDSFDNMYVDNTLKRLWREKYNSEPIKMRHWELNERYQVTNSSSLTRKEVKRIFLLSVPTLLFAVTAICVIVADLSLAKFLDILKDKGSYGISFKGMEQGIHLGSLLSSVQNGETSIVSLQIEAFDLSTDPCLPVAKNTEKRKLGWLLVIVFVCIFSCLADAYAARWRSQICNLFHEKKAKERAQYLLNRITAGRGNRRFQLRLIASREKRRQDRLAEISLAHKLSQCISRLRKSKPSVNCHGCDWKVAKGETKEQIFKVNGNNVVTTLCNDCFQDI